jgi:protein-S-isoprenylcysteine O-methyltransferase Ste14
MIDSKCLVCRDTGLSGLHHKFPAVHPNPCGEAHRWWFDKSLKLFFKRSEKVMYPTAAIVDFQPCFTYCTLPRPHLYPTGLPDISKSLNCQMPTNLSNDNAGVVAPAPVLYGIAFAIGFAAEKIAPSQLLPLPASVWLGLAFIAVAIAMVVSAFNALAQAHTAFDARKPTNTIVTTGAFRFSRNPTYLSLTLLLIGIAFAISSLWVLVSVIPAVLATQWGVILREEGYLKEKFGDGYIRYASKVRRWL